MDTPASSHDHPLVLNHTMHNRHELASLLHCNKCGYAIVRGSFYSCFHCGYHLHYHCAVTMPPKINHPFHPQHPLSWCIIGSFTCAFCYPHDSNFLNPLREEYYSYSCIEYNLKLDIECALAPTITCYDDQTRPLCHLQPMDLVEKEDGLSFSACCVCESPSRFGSSTYYYYCKICEYYCDSCEKERDPRLCVYYCEGCKYVAHVQCVISEVLRVLKGELKDVELRIVGQNELDTEIMEKNLVLDKEKEESALVGEQGKASMTLMDLVSELSKRIGRFALSVSRL
ncbi:protein VACUOLELESS GAMETOPHYTES isoform X2 [Ziziphus jujuba]|uniref:Protein VACUOLELESS GAMETOPHYTES isoform X2 n=1 Tax=Ziziphus jujuba TaxID=326968 RepID=A0A6P6GFQ4_ZIZJJ|nr:protein VACUOLELESS GAMETOPHYTES isoform X2 [Ziziphus jujuba]